MKSLPFESPRSSGRLQRTESPELLPRHEVEAFRSAIAALIGCSRDEVVENATRAWDMAFYAFRFQPGDRILTTQAEYASSNYIALRQVAKHTGVTITFIPNDDAGQVDVDALAATLDERVSLVHVPTQGGLVNPAAAVAEVTRAAGVPLLLDACQSVGQMPIDVEAIGCDILSATGRKFIPGARGTGFLYVRRELLDRLEPPPLDLHAAEGLPAATTVFEPTPAGSRTGRRTPRPRSASASLSTTRWNGASTPSARGSTPSPTNSGIAAAICPESRPLTRALRNRYLLDRLPAPHDVAAAYTPKPSTSRSPLGAYSRLDFEQRGLTDLVRASVHYYNSNRELDRLTDAVGSLVAAQRTR